MRFATQQLYLLRHITAVGSLLLAAGCASVAPLATAPSAAEFTTATVVMAPSAANCRQWYGLLDEAIAQSGSTDAETVRISGFAQLRMDRFAASFQDTLADTHGDAASTAQRAALLDYLRGLDSEARLIEIANLDAPRRVALKLGNAAQLRPLLDTCSAEMTRVQFNDSEPFATLAKALTVPDNYADWKRALGWYPLSSIPFFKGVRAWQRDTAAQFAQAALNAQRAAALPKTTRYLPRGEITAEKGRTGDSAQRFAASPRDALGIAQMNAQDWAALLAQYAPVFDIEKRGDSPEASDRFGAMHLTADAQPGVDGNRPTAYQRIAFTRYGGKTLTQLVYAIWFPERPAQHFIDLLSGQLDGVIIRITLDERGVPLLVDSIHACGCYHLFFSTPHLRARAAPQADMEWAFVPAPLPALRAGQRLQVRLAPATHYLLDIRLFDGAAGGGDVRYALHDDSELRSLPLPGGGYKSIFGADGIIAGSERGERFFFWPMGIASPGAMRQWGNHATAFVGRRHFDDADLIEQRFEIKAEQP